MHPRVVFRSSDFFLLLDCYCRSAAEAQSRRGPGASYFCANGLSQLLHAQYRKHKPPRGQGLGDRNLKSEGYGVVIVDHKARTYQLQCWLWNEARQFPGWPITLRFDEA